MTIMSEIVENILKLGFIEVSHKPAWPAYNSRPSQIVGGPVVCVRYEPYSGCDGWYIGNGNDWILLPNMENKDKLIKLLDALDIPHE